MSQLLIHSWHDARLGQINPMVWVTGAHEMAQLVAASVAEQLARREPEKRVLIICPAIVDLWAGDLVRLIGQGPNTTVHVRWFTSFFETLKRRGIKPAFIMLDEEFGFSTFTILARTRTGPERIAAMRRFYDDPAVRAKMPENVRALKPEDFASGAWWYPGHPPTVAWNVWASQAVGQLIRTVVFEPMRNVWPGFTDYANYGSSALKFPVVDLNGWPVDSLDLGGWSSPSLYLFPGLASRNRAKHELWNRLIISMNLFRSAMMSGTQVMPWMSVASYSGDSPPFAPRGIMRWLWGVLMDDLLAAGVGQFIYFNPAPGLDPLVDNRIVCAVADRQAQIAQPAARPADLPRIEWDAEQIIVGDQAVTYAQFLSHLQD